jgi:hypothetical protein
MHPSSERGDMSVPPRPEKRYILPLRTAEAVPTRGVGAVERDLVERFGVAELG